MSSNSTSVPRSSATTRGRYLGIAVLASILHAAMMIPGYNEEEGDFQTGAFLAMLAFSLVISIAVFLFIVPRGGVVTGVVLAVLALLSVLVFWAALTLPLAAAAAVTALGARQRGERPGLATVALALAVLAAIAVVAVIIGDATSN